MRAFRIIHIICPLAAWTEVLFNLILILDALDIAILFALSFLYLPVCLYNALAHAKLYRKVKNREKYNRGNYKNEKNSTIHNLFHTSFVGVTSR